MRSQIQPPYGSAADLPSFVEMTRQLSALKALTLFIGRDQRAAVLELEVTLRRLTELVDRFYAVLGQRNWVFPDSLSTTVMATFLGDDATLDGAERGLIALYQEPGTLSRLLGGVTSLPALRVRMPLLEKAHADYEACRYYATVLVLLTVMDGFVNEVDSERRGLHARGAKEMAAWDSVVGHHLGLAHAHRAFTKSTGRTTEEETTELHRHGIVHGTILNYNNVVVATKAWNRLFAVADWARSRTRQEEPATPQPSLRESLRKLEKARRTNEAVARWRPSTLTPTDPGFEELDIVRRASECLAAWSRSDYGGLAHYVPRSRSGPTRNATAGIQRALYETFRLTDFALRRVDFVSAAVCEVLVDLTVNGVARQGMMRWIREDSDGKAAVATEPGDWLLYIGDPVSIMARADEGAPGMGREPQLP